MSRDKLFILCFYIFATLSILSCFYGIFICHRSWLFLPVTAVVISCFAPSSEKE